MANVRSNTSINWWDAEPTRHGIDQLEVPARFPDLRWVPKDAGRWEGHLPLWPLNRRPPAGLSDLLGGKGLQVIILYRQAYPMVAPRIYPTDPRPEPLECTQHRWHVNGDGSLCLFQAETVWNPADSICDLIVKAAAWRVEYALLKAGALAAMTTNGIVSDSQHDDLITETALAAAVDAPSPSTLADDV